MITRLKRLALTRALLAVLATLACALPACGNDPPPLTQEIVVAISPSTVALVPGATRQFTAAVTGTGNTAVTYSVTESNGGSVTASGLYTAPAAAGSFHVVAASVQDPTRKSTAVVVVVPPGVTITLSPASASVLVGATQQFTATVTGSANTAVTYSVTEASGGTLTAGGLYTAPAAAGTFHVVATSAADTSKTASAVVTVTATSGAATALAWTDPVSGTYQLKKNAGLSTATHLVLDLTGVGAPAGSGLAFTLSADAAFATWTKVAAADTELIQNGTVLALGTGVLALRGKATGALLQGVTAKKGLGGAVALNGVLARVALDLKAGAARGAVALAATKAQVLLADGSLSAVGIAAGTLTAQ